MKPRVEIETTRALIANIEMTMRRTGNLSPERKAWFMGARCALSYVLEMPRGAAMLERMIRVQSMESLIHAQVGSAALDEQNNPNTGE